ncbi:MAG: UDP-N-acetylmuramate dehydrogenase [Verrucomicrobiota bacterium]|nr:UDP-N-acetylmuramate dehydrogenase [Verrucomicrobiota bacterium]
MLEVISISPEQRFSELAETFSPGTFWRQNEPMARHTTLRVGGAADFYVEPISESELAKIVQFCGKNDLPFLVIGRGSNLLVRDGGIRGVVISLAQQSFSRIEIEGEHLKCGAGAKLKQVSQEARRHHLTGLEFLEGIPGSVGGALRMNAGAMESALFDVVESVRSMDFAGEIFESSADEIEVNYRACPFFKNHIALGATLHGKIASPKIIEKRLKTFNQKRWDSQPPKPSAGCIFKNPQTIPAGKLVEELGLKNRRVGGAIVSDLHGNFIVNEGDATARDVLKLIEQIQQRAKSERGIELQTEVEIIGEDAP